MPEPRQAVASRTGQTRVIACCGGMFRLGGLERMVFLALEVVRAGGGAVHCLFNPWTGPDVLEAADRLGATRAPGGYRRRLSRRPGDPVALGRSLWDMLQTSSRLLVECVRFRPTHVLVPEFGVALHNWPALVLCRAARVPVVLAVQNAPADGRFYRFIWRRLVNAAVTRCICAADATRTKLQRLGVPAAKLRVVYNTAGHPPAEEPPAEDAGTRVLFVGQLIPEKGVDLLLEAVAELRRRGIDAVLDVVGEATGWVAPNHAGYRESLFARAARPDLEGAVRFLGWRDDVPALLRHVSVHCLPSRPEMYEGLPLVVVEAKQAGVPSVTFAHEPFPELIEHGRTGWLCRDLTPGALAEGLEHFLAPGRRAEVDEAVRRSALRFGRERFLDGWRAAFADDLRRQSFVASAGESRPDASVFQSPGGRR